MSKSFVNPEIQYKAATQGAINLDEARGIVECFVAGIGNKDSVGDVCAPGAFAKSLLRRKPRVVWGHNWNDPIGKVLEIYEVPANDPRLPSKMRAAGIGGLYAKVQFNLMSEKGKEAFASVAFFGEEQEWSIGYKTINAKFDQQMQANVLFEVELYEVSPVLHGANQLTGTISVKSDENNATAVMERAVSSIANADSENSPELKEVLYALRNIASMISDNEKHEYGMPSVMPSANRQPIPSMPSPAPSTAPRSVVKPTRPSIPENPMVVALRRELVARTGSNIIVRSAGDNVVVFDRIMSDGSSCTYRLAYHYADGEFMFGKPEKVNAQTVYTPETPGAPGDAYWGDDYSETPKSLQSGDFWSAGFYSELTSQPDTSNALMEVIESLQHLINEKSEYVIPVEPAEAFELRQMIDPVLEYYNADARVTEEGIVVKSAHNPELIEALDVATKSVLGKIRRGIGAGRRLDAPNIGGGKGRSRAARAIGAATGGVAGNLDPSKISLNDPDGDGWAREGSRNPVWVGFKKAVEKIAGSVGRKKKPSKDKQRARSAVNADKPGPPRVRSGAPWDAPLTPAPPRPSRVTLTDDAGARLRELGKERARELGFDRNIDPVLPRPRKKLTNQVSAAPRPGEGRSRASGESIANAIRRSKSAPNPVLGQEMANDVAKFGYPEEMSTDDLVRTVGKFRGEIAKARENLEKIQADRDSGKKVSSSEIGKARQSVDSLRQRASVYSSEISKRDKIKGSDRFSSGKAITPEDRRKRRHAPLGTTGEFDLPDEVATRNKHEEFVAEFRKNNGFWLDIPREGTVASMNTSEEWQRAREIATNVGILEWQENERNRRPKGFSEKARSSMDYLTWFGGYTKRLGDYLDREESSENVTDDELAGARAAVLDALAFRMATPTGPESQNTLAAMLADAGFGPNGKHEKAFGGRKKSSVVGFSSGRGNRVDTRVLDQLMNDGKEVSDDDVKAILMPNAGILMHPEYNDRTGEVSLGWKNVLESSLEDRSFNRGSQRAMIRLDDEGYQKFTEALEAANGELTPSDGLPSSSRSVRDREYPYSWGKSRMGAFSSGRKYPPEIEDELVFDSELGGNRAADRINTENVDMEIVPSSDIGLDGPDDGAWTVVGMYRGEDYGSVDYIYELDTFDSVEEARRFIETFDRLIDEEIRPGDPDFFLDIDNYNKDNKISLDDDLDSAISKAVQSRKDRENDPYDYGSLLSSVLSDRSLNLFGDGESRFSSGRNKAERRQSVKRVMAEDMADREVNLGILSRRMKGETLDEVGRAYGIDRGTVRQMEMREMKRLRDGATPSEILAYRMTGLTLDDMGRMLGMSREEVRRIESREIARMRLGGRDGSDAIFEGRKAGLSRNSIKKLTGMSMDDIATKERKGFERAVTREDVSHQIFDKYVTRFGEDELTDAELAEELGVSERIVSEVRAGAKKDILDARRGMDEHYSSLPEPTDEELQEMADYYANDFAREQGFGSYAEYKDYVSSVGREDDGERLSSGAGKRDLTFSQKVGQRVFEEAEKIAKEDNRDIFDTLDSLVFDKRMDSTNRRKDFDVAEMYSHINSLLFPEGARESRKRRLWRRERLSSGRTGRGRKNRRQGKSNQGAWSEEDLQRFRDRNVLRAKTRPGKRKDGPSAEEFSSGRKRIDTAGSSALTGAFYDADNKRLVVGFNKGGVYAYDGVTPEDIEEMHNAESKGAAMASIKKKYKGVRLSEADDSFKATKQGDEWVVNPDNETTYSISEDGGEFFVLRTSGSYARDGGQSGDEYYHPESFKNMDSAMKWVEQDFLPSITPEPWDEDDYDVDRLSSGGPARAAAQMQFDTRRSRKATEMTYDPQDGRVGITYNDGKQRFFSEVPYEVARAAGNPSKDIDNFIDDLERGKVGKEGGRFSSGASSVPRTDFDYSYQKFPPTEEQAVIADAVATGENVIVRAFAGTGKTSTLVMIAERLKRQDPKKKIVYMAFNKDIQLEAEGKFPGNTESRTGDSISWNWVKQTMGEAFTDRMKGNPPERVKSKGTRNKDISIHFKIKQMEHPDGLKDEKTGNPIVLDAVDVTKLVREAVKEFLISEDDEIGTQHFKKIQNVPPALLGHAKAIWDDMNDPDGVMKLDNSVFTKMWALSRPQLSDGVGLFKGKPSVIFFDEAQDINPVMAKVMREQNIQVIFVGDSYQAIYGFRGASDSLEKAEATYDLPLTGSWRFDSKIAGYANRFLAYMGSKDRIRGVGKPGDGVVEPESMVDPDAILTRSNGGALRAVVEQIKNGRIVGTSENFKKDLTKFAWHAISLKADKPVKNPHPELEEFSSWQEVTDAANAEDASPRLRMLVQLFNDTPNIIEILDQVVVGGKLRGESGGGSGKRILPSEVTDGFEMSIDPSSLGKWAGDKKTSVLYKNGKLFFQLPYTAKGSSGDDSKKSWIKENLGKINRFEYGKPEETGGKFAVFVDATPEQAAKLLSGITSGDAQEVDVMVMTAHRSKGLEFGKVQLYGDFPRPRKNKNTGEMEYPAPEEQRLQYVASTRAIRELDPGPTSWIYNETSEDDESPGVPSGFSSGAKGNPMPSAIGKDMVLEDGGTYEDNMFRGTYVADFNGGKMVIQPAGRDSWAVYRADFMGGEDGPSYNFSYGPPTDESEFSSLADAYEHVLNYVKDNDITLDQMDGSRRSKGSESFSVAKIGNSGSGISERFSSGRKNADKRLKAARKFSRGGDANDDGRLSSGKRDSDEGFASGRILSRLRGREETTQKEADELYKWAAEASKKRPDDEYLSRVVGKGSEYGEGLDEKDFEYIRQQQLIDFIVDNDLHLRDPEGAGRILDIWTGESRGRIKDKDWEALSELRYRRQQREDDAFNREALKDVAESQGMPRDDQQKLAIFAWAASRFGKYPLVEDVVRGGRTNIPNSLDDREWKFLKTEWLNSDAPDPQPLNTRMTNGDMGPDRYLEQDYLAYMRESGMTGLLEKYQTRGGLTGKDWAYVKKLHDDLGPRGWRNPKSASYRGITRKERREIDKKTGRLSDWDVLTEAQRASLEKRKEKFNLTESMANALSSGRTTPNKPKQDDGRLSSGGDPTPEQIEAEDRENRADFYKNSSGLYENELAEWLDANPSKTEKDYESSPEFAERLDDMDSIMGDFADAEAERRLDDYANRMSSGGKPPRYPRPPTLGAFLGSTDDLFKNVDSWEDFRNIYNDQEIIFFDYETTGLVFDEFGRATSNGAPVQFGAVKIKNGKEIGRINLFMNPGESLGEWSRNNLKDIDGNPLTDDWLGGQISVEDAHKQLIEFAGADAIFGVQNATFDKAVLDDVLSKMKSDWRPSGYIDTRELASLVLPRWTPETEDGPFQTNKDGEKVPSSSLAAITEYLDVELGDGHHNADVDAFAASEVMRKMIDGAIENDWSRDALSKEKRDSRHAETIAKFEESVRQFESELSQYGLSSGRRQRPSDEEIYNLRMSGPTLEEVGEKYGMTRQEVRAAEMRHIRKMRDADFEATGAQTSRRERRLSSGGRPTRAGSAKQRGKVVLTSQEPGGKWTDVPENQLSRKDDFFDNETASRILDNPLENYNDQTGWPVAARDFFQSLVLQQEGRDIPVMDEDGRFTPEGRNQVKKMLFGSNEAREKFLDQIESGDVSHMQAVAAITILEKLGDDNTKLGPRGASDHMLETFGFKSAPVWVSGLDSRDPDYDLIRGEVNWTPLSEEQWLDEVKQAYVDNKNITNYVGNRRDWVTKNKGKSEKDYESSPEFIADAKRAYLENKNTIGPAEVYSHPFTHFYGMREEQKDTVKKNWLSQNPGKTDADYDKAMSWDGEGDPDKSTEAGSWGFGDPRSLGGKPSTQADGASSKRPTSARGTTKRPTSARGTTTSSLPPETTQKLFQAIKLDTILSALGIKDDVTREEQRKKLSELIGFTITEDSFKGYKRTGPRPRIILELLRRGHIKDLDSLREADRTDANLGNLVNQARDSVFIATAYGRLREAARGAGLSEDSFGARLWGRLGKEYEDHVINGKGQPRSRMADGAIPKTFNLSKLDLIGETELSELVDGLNAMAESEGSSARFTIDDIFPKNDRGYIDAFGESKIRMSSGKPSTQKGQRFVAKPKGNRLTSAANDTAEMRFSSAARPTYRTPGGGIDKDAMSADIEDAIRGPRLGAVAITSANAETVGREQVDNLTRAITLRQHIADMFPSVVNDRTQVSYDIEPLLTEQGISPKDAEKLTDLVNDLDEYIDGIVKQFEDEGDKLESGLREMTDMLDEVSELRKYRKETIDKYGEDDARNLIDRLDEKINKLTTSIDDKYQATIGSNRTNMAKLRDEALALVDENPGFDRPKKGGDKPRLSSGANSLSSKLIGIEMAMGRAEEGGLPKYKPVSKMDMNLPNGTRLSSGKADEWYENLTAKLVEQIEKIQASGGDKWEFPWHRTGAMPKNAISGHVFSGMNPFVLLLAADEKGYSTHRWATYKQWQSVGGNVMKNEKGQTLLKPVFKKVKDPDTGKEETKLVNWSAYTVFNVAQVEGINPEDYDDKPKDLLDEAARVERAEKAFAIVGADIETGDGSRAYYSPSNDKIVMPPFAYFKTPEGYYATLGHELVHWTGHSSRLDRPNMNRFGTPAYAREELVAELGSAFLMANFGMAAEPREDHAHYLANWLKVLREEPKALQEAAREAQKASKLLIEKMREVLEGAEVAEETLDDVDGTKSAWVGMSDDIGRESLLQVAGILPAYLRMEVEAAIKSTAPGGPLSTKVINRISKTIELLETFSKQKGI